MSVVYLNGEFVEKAKATISPDDRGFLFGDGLYEVIRSYNGTLFRAEEHLRRMENGAEKLKFNRTEFSEFKNVAEKLIALNALAEGDATIYLQISRGEAQRTHHFPSKTTPLTIFASAKKLQPKTEDQKQGIKVILVPDQRWSRCDIKSTCLLPNILANQQAKENGASEALFVRDGYVMEGSRSNFMIVKNEVVITPPATNYILPGITRQVVLELAQAQGLAINERSISLDDLRTADELMIVGTTIEITPIIRVEGIKNLWNNWPVTKTMQAKLRETTP